MTDRCFWQMLFLIYPKQPEARKSGKHTLIISVRWHSGSRPAMGRILIFCVLEHLSARDSVIFRCVALSVEWGLPGRKQKVLQLFIKYTPEALTSIPQRGQWALSVHWKNSKRYHTAESTRWGTVSILYSALRHSLSQSDTRNRTLQ